MDSVQTVHYPYKGRLKCFVPDEVIIQEVTADRQGLQDIITDLSQELTVFCKGLRVWVSTFVCAELQHDCVQDKKKYIVIVQI